MNSSIVPDTDGDNHLPKPFQADTLSPTRFGMLTAFALLVRGLYFWIYSRVVHEPKQVQEIRSIPENESIVYLLDSENKHDYLFLNDLCLKMGLRLAYTGNGQSKLRYAPINRRLFSIFSKRKKKPTPADIAEAVLERRPVLIFLNQYGLKERENIARTEAILEAIRELAIEHPELKIHFVPVGIIWERRAETYHHTLFNELYGTPTRPSSIRRFITVSNPLQLFMQIGKPLCLIHHQILDFNELKTGAQIRRVLNDDIDMMHTQVNGPKVKPHQQLLREIVQSESFQEELKSISQSTGQRQEELVLEARKILDKTASKFSLLVCKIFCAVFTPMWSTIYNGLYYDTEKFNEIRELSKTHRLVFIPSHKSHIDYLVLSILLFQNGVLPPHIAAGENLNFPPVGGILRRGGAFFIKRSFRGELLYTACIKHYIDKILHEGYPVEFFIEGGRSRTGQVLQPKFGILRMIAQAVVGDPSLPVKIIPCAITYEKVIEDMAYKNEQDGAVKQKENITNLIRTTRLLISKYGQIYVSFASPIDLNDALHLSPEHSVTEADLTNDIDVMALELMNRINRASTITTSSLLSCALLNARKLPARIDDLLGSAAFFLALLIERKAVISPVLQTALAASRATLHEPQYSEEMPAISDSGASADLDYSSLVSPLREPMIETLKLFDKEYNGAIRKGDDEIIDIDADGRLQMAFYKNILLFALIDDIYISCALLSLKDEARTKDALCERFREIADLFSIEFSPSGMDERFSETLNTFLNRHWISAEDDRIIIVPEAMDAIRNLSRCMENHIESYQAVYRAFEHITETVEESGMINELLAQAKLDVEAHRILPESRSKVFYSHALQKLQSHNMFDVSYAQNGRKHAKYLKKSQELSANMTQLLEDLSFFHREG